MPVDKRQLTERLREALATIVNEAVDSETEACAKIADKYYEESIGDHSSGTAAAIADEIRKRTNSQ